MVTTRWSWSSCLIWAWPKACASRRCRRACGGRFPSWPFLSGTASRERRKSHHLRAQTLLCAWA
eukprot:4899501-Alexandrium_andersonii.AAC.1